MTDRVIQKTKFVIIPNWLAKYCNAREISMYFALGKYKNNETNTCYPSISQLAKDMDISRETAKRGLKGLIDKGIVIRTVRKTEDGKNTSNIYELIFDENDIKLEGLGSNITLPKVKNDPNPRVIDEPQTIPNNNYTNITISKKNQDFSTSVKETPFYSKDIQTVYVDMLVKAFNLDNITRNKWGQIYNTAKQLFEAEIAPDEIPLLVQNVALTYGEKYTTINSILNHTELLNGVKDKSADDIKQMLNNKELSEWANDK